MTVSELLENWLEEKRCSVRPQTYARYKGLIELHIASEFKSAEVSAVSRRHIIDFIAGKQAGAGRNSNGGMSPVSINLMLSVLSMAFEYALDHEILKSNPCERVRRIPSSACRYVDAFTKEEQIKLEQVINESDDERLFGIRLCFYTGLRIGELLGLEWNDFNENCNILTVSKTIYRARDENGCWQVFSDSPKTASSYRRIPLPEHMSRCLREKRGGIGEFVVQNKKGERMPTRSYQYIFEKLTQKARVRRLSFHAIRHTFATRALECGMDIKTLSEIMGHSDAGITLNRYAHSMMDTKIMMMERMLPII